MNRRRITALAFVPAASATLFPGAAGIANAATPTPTPTPTRTPTDSTHWARFDLTIPNDTTSTPTLRSDSHYFRSSNSGYRQQQPPQTLQPKP